PVWRFCKIWKAAGNLRLPYQETSGILLVFYRREPEMENTTALVTEFVERYAALYAYNLIMAIVILLVGLWLVKRIANVTENALKRRLDITVASFLSRLLHIALIIFVAIAALDRLG